VLKMSEKLLVMSITHEAALRHTLIPVLTFF